MDEIHSSTFYKAGQWLDVRSAQSTIVEEYMTSGTGVEGTGFNSSDAKFDFYLPTLTEQHRMTLFNS